MVVGKLLDYLANLKTLLTEILLSGSFVGGRILRGKHTHK